MRRLSTAAVVGLVLVFTTTAIAEPPSPAADVAKKKRKCFKKKHGKRVRVKCPRKKKPSTQTPTTQTPTAETTPPATTAPASPSDETGQSAIDKMTAELKGGRCRYFTSGYDSSTSYLLDLCADGTFLRAAESAGVQTYRTGTWKVTDAVIFGDGSGRAARIQGTTTSSDPPGAEDLVADLGVRNSDNQWFWGENAAQYFPGAAICEPDA
jgi:hypothetical protein